MIQMFLTYLNRFLESCHKNVQKMPLLNSPGFILFIGIESFYYLRLGIAVLCVLGSYSNVSLRARNMFSYITEKML